MITFSTGQKVQSFINGLRDTFPFFRSFLSDADDSEIAFFLSTLDADEEVLSKIELVIARGIRAIVANYPDMTPPRVVITKGYENEAVLAQSVMRLIQMMIHLQSCASSFGKVIELGGDPRDL